MGIARWDGNNWWPVGTNSDCGSCDGTIEKYDNKIFFSGNNMLGLAWGVIAWDGTNWVNRCSLPPINLLKGYSNDLLAGNSFWGNFLKFEGDTNWSLQPYGGIYGGIDKAERDTVNNLLYVSGDFDWVNINKPIRSHNIAMYDGFGWHSMDTLIGCILTIKVYNGSLYAGTCLDTMTNGTTIGYIARWDDNQWHPLGSGVNNGGVSALEEFHDTLFVTGGFTTAGGDSAYGLARWYMPDTNCAFLKPTIHTLALQDTFYLSAGQVSVQFFNNNAYAQTWQWNFGDTGTGNTQNPAHTYTHDSVYTITVTVTEDGCTKTGTAVIWVLNGSGNEEYTQESLQFKVYPNPTNGDFTIECTLPQNKKGTVKAFKTIGSQLGEHPLEPGCNNFIMPAGSWKDSVILVGVYIDGRQVLVEKVVKQ
ncbi:MAG: PKD domain-containing protein [Bacteroidia bacterium]|nr:PKD domain-containing protein [Bacteroidia bacterium]